MKIKLEGNILKVTPRKGFTVHVREINSKSHWDFLKPLSYPSPGNREYTFQVETGKFYEVFEVSGRWNSWYEAYIHIPEEGKLTFTSYWQAVSKASQQGGGETVASQPTQTPLPPQPHPP